MASVPEWLERAVADFARACQERLAGGAGGAEAAIRSPLEQLMREAGAQFGLDVVMHGEAPLADLGVRLDYAVRVNGAVTGYLEVKRPGTSLDPEGFRGHNHRQWNRLKKLPLLIYTNGNEWRLYKSGRLVEKANLDGNLEAPGHPILISDSALERILIDFLRWTPPPIVSVDDLVETVAPLCRLLRQFVVDQMALEKKAVREGADEWRQPFSGLARDWRSLLFPTVSDTVFADYYAQTLTFSLLLARSEGIDVAGADMNAISVQLRAGQTHELMGKALQLLTESATDQLSDLLDLLRRVIGAVDWHRVRRGERDAYLHLYESFLNMYDPELRQNSGVYYTPREVVDSMVRLTGEILANRLNTPDKFLAPTVTTVDPAMGTGTYLHAIIEQTAQQVTDRQGPGSVPSAISSLAERLMGFEKQMGPYAVAEMRAVDLMRSYNAKLPQHGMHMYVTDTLDDPFVAVPSIASAYEPIARSRRRANDVKGKIPVTVVIGNPPYRRAAEGQGGWAESGGCGRRAPLDRFRMTGNGRMEYVLKSQYIYFWAWATWKVFESLDNGHHGVVAFITPAGYLKGPGFKGMRRYLRQTCSEGWVINVTPEGMEPDVSTRVFPGVRQTLAIGIFVRRRTGVDSDTPADLYFSEVTGQRDDKYRRLKNISITDSSWRHIRNDWDAPFTPTSESSWDDYPALGDLFPWTTTGITSNRRWVYAPSPDILRRRWAVLVGERNPTRKSVLLKRTVDRDIDSKVEPLNGYLPNPKNLREETEPCPEPRRVAYRFLDRQWIIPDRRVIDRPRPNLWAAEVRGQVFISEQHSQPIGPGPAVTFAGLIPETHHFKGSEGGRVIPMMHPDGSGNVAPSLLQALGREYGKSVSVEELTAYIAAVVSHPLFTTRFLDELQTPGVRVPITRTSKLFDQAVHLGQELLWAVTYGATAADIDQGRPPNAIAFSSGDARRIVNVSSMGDRLPEHISYDEAAQIVHVGKAGFGPVTRLMWDYSVSGMRVIKHWFGYRKAEPGGRRTSPLDDIYIDRWPYEWVQEFNELLTALRRIVDLEEAQALTLEAILNGPVITAGELARAGVRFPRTDRERQPRANHM
ncbi:type ISP restriction/modification enzyme [Actinomadura citrea]|uniref:site-specific DNA-methyltransferase (adenine-specific) n=1 Tax=Actinomadura citrea TaxID=46158 RepID=A0A7Y9KHI4_9ACTN|nr:type ISP restriction/modification enzyme [Actinomadura citrea]NYE16073.1 hypothetical protein [Actinomadura citrea]GGT80948.1 hypothetical protein GCM10010177_44970 [Actinomadura citrea]